MWKKIFLIAILAGVLYGGCNSQSLRTAEDFLRKNPKLALAPKGCYLIGNIAYLTFRYNLAAGIMERNLKDFPYQPGAEDAQYRRAVCFEKLGKYNTAISQYEQFLADHPKSKRYDSVLNKVGKLKALHQEQ